MKQPKPFLLQPASDWTGQTYEERLRLSIETLYVSGILPPRAFNQALTKLAERSEKEREQYAKRCAMEAA